MLHLFSARPLAIVGSCLPVTYASTKWGKTGDEFEHQKRRERVCSWEETLDHPGDFLQPVLGDLQLNPVSSLGVSCGSGCQVDCLLATLCIHLGQVFVLGSKEPLGGCWESQLAWRKWGHREVPCASLHFESMVYILMFLKNSNLLCTLQVSQSCQACLPPQHTVQHCCAFSQPFPFPLTLASFGVPSLLCIYHPSPLTGQTDECLLGIGLARPLGRAEAASVHVSLPRNAGYSGRCKHVWLVCVFHSWLLWKQRLNLPLSSWSALTLSFLKGSIWQCLKRYFVGPRHGGTCL